jgi:hypothetical protein
VYPCADSGGCGCVCTTNSMADKKVTNKGLYGASVEAKHNVRVLDNSDGESADSDSEKDEESKEEKKQSTPPTTTTTIKKEKESNAPTKTKDNGDSDNDDEEEEEEEEEEGHNDSDTSADDNDEPDIKCVECDAYRGDEGPTLCGEYHDDDSYNICNECATAQCSHCFGTVCKQHFRYLFMARESTVCVGCLFLAEEAEIAKAAGCEPSHPSYFSRVLMKVKNGIDNLRKHDVMLRADEEQSEIAKRPQYDVCEAKSCEKKREFNQTMICPSCELNRVCIDTCIATCRKCSRKCCLECALFTMKKDVNECQIECEGFTPTKKKAAETTEDDSSNKKKKQKQTHKPDESSSSSSSSSSGGVATGAGAKRDNKRVGKGKKHASAST